MIEPESMKVFALMGGAVVAKFLGDISANTGMPDIDKWIERGGTGLCLGLLILAVKALRAERDATQKRLNDMHDKEVESVIKNAEAREKLAAAIDKLSEKIDKK